ncbi:MAG: hypothetical protein E5V36_07635 [Mesorhizobium sp.]|nr:MAG: hypothetical protein E5V36_07635 [Mesorhizobium sp.]
MKPLAAQRLLKLEILAVIVGARSLQHFDCTHEAVNNIVHPRLDAGEPVWANVSPNPQACGKSGRAPKKSFDAEATLGTPPYWTGRCIKSGDTKEFACGDQGKRAPELLDRQ